MKSQFRGEFSNDDEGRRDATRWWLWFVGMIILTAVIFGVFKFISKPAAVLDRVTDPDHIITSYEEFQNIYNTTQQLCTDLLVLDELPDDEKSGGFSKAERIVAVKQTLSRWVEEYNSKSRQLTRNKWKNTNLPYQLSFKTVCNEESN